MVNSRGRARVKSTKDELRQYWEMRAFLSRQIQETRARLAALQTARLIMDEWEVDLFVRLAEARGNESPHLGGLGGAHRGLVDRPSAA